MLPTPERAAPQPSTRSLIDQGEPLGLRLPRIALPLAQPFPSASLSTRPLIGSMVANEREQHEINVGDVVHIKAGERHWHGAKAETTMGHITITLVGSQAAHG
jgi:hypothetical protein